MTISSCAEACTFGTTFALATSEACPDHTGHPDQQVASCVLLPSRAMQSGLAEKTVLVTGASGGIGRALATAFADEGCNLVLHAHAGATSLAAWVEEQPWRARAEIVVADVRQCEAVEEATMVGVRRFGRLDVAIANAGIWPEASLRLDELPPERVREVLEINLLGAMWTARAFMRAIGRTGPRDDGHGASLVFVGSTAGRFGEAGHSEYAASKAALVGLMLSLKNEVTALDPWARVNLVQPGWTVTPMTADAVTDPKLVARVLAGMPLRQLARPEDVARACLVLSAPLLSRHVSGETITVAGGMEGRQLWTADDVDLRSVQSRLSPDE